jgi:hypothetical protein
MQTAELVALPLAERLLAMEVLWDSLCRDSPDSAAIPSWHEEVLGKRLAALESGQEVVSPWIEAKERIRLGAKQMIQPG